MKAMLAVGLGGFAGSVARDKLGGMVLHHSLLVGLLAGWSEHRGALGPTLRLLLITTFSAFGLETPYLLRRDAAGLAALNVVLSVAGGIIGVWIGWKASHG